MHAWPGKAWSVPGAPLTTKQQKRLQMLKVASPGLAGTDLHAPPAFAMLTSTHCHAMISPLHSRQHDQHVQSSAYRGGPHTLTLAASNHVSLHFSTQKQFQNKQHDTVAWTFFPVFRAVQRWASASADFARRHNPVNPIVHSRTVTRLKGWRPFNREGQEASYKDEATSTKGDGDNDSGLSQLEGGMGQLVHYLMPQVFIVAIFRKAQQVYAVCFAHANQACV